MGNRGSCAVDSSRIHIKSPTEWRVSLAYRMTMRLLLLHPLPECKFWGDLSQALLFLFMSMFSDPAAAYSSVPHLSVSYDHRSFSSAFSLFHLQFLWQSLWFIAEIITVSRSNHFFCSHYLFATFQLVQEDGMCDVALRSAISCYKWNNNFCLLFLWLHMGSDYSELHKSQCCRNWVILLHNCLSWDHIWTCQVIFFSVSPGQHIPKDFILCIFIFNFLWFDIFTSKSYFTEITVWLTSSTDKFPIQ